MERYASAVEAVIGAQMTHEPLLVTAPVPEQAEVVVCICIGGVEFETSRIATLGVIQATDAFEGHGPVEVQHFVFRKMSQSLLEYAERILAPPFVFAKERTQIHVRSVKRLRRKLEGLSVGLLRALYVRIGQLLRKCVPFFSLNCSVLLSGPCIQKHDVALDFSDFEIQKKLAGIGVPLRWPGFDCNRVTPQR